MKISLDYIEAPLRSLKVWCVRIMIESLGNETATYANVGREDRPRILEKGRNDDKRDIFIT